jgi:hypothetical protein
LRPKQIREIDSRCQLSTKLPETEVADGDDESYVLSDDEVDVSPETEVADGEVAPGTEVGDGGDVALDSRRFRCDECGKSYLWKHHLHRHQKQAHEPRQQLLNGQASILQISFSDKEKFGQIFIVQFWTKLRQKAEMRSYMKLHIIDIYLVF